MKFLHFAHFSHDGTTFVYRHMDKICPITEKIDLNMGISCNTEMPWPVILKFLPIML